MPPVGIIGGSGLYDLEGLRVIKEEQILTPYGEPSGPFVIGSLDDTDVVFIARHGKGHTIAPHEINYRANLFGLMRLGVRAVLSVSAVGSLKETIRPLDFVVPDQFVDLTKKRPVTFFGDGVVVHVGLAEPFDPQLRRILIEAATACGVTVHEKGVYVNIEGPQFSTKAESELYRRWGMDIIGMTNATEARLAREAQLAYATLAAVTDFDCWHPDHDTVTAQMVLENLRINSRNALNILKKAVLKAARITTFPANKALENTVVTDPKSMTEDHHRKLRLFMKQS